MVSLHAGSLSRRYRMRLSYASYSDDHFGHDAFGEDFLRLELPVGDALLKRVNRQLLPGRAVFFDAIGIEVAEAVAHLARIGGQPRHRIARYGGIENPLDAAAFGFQERVVEIARRPGMLVQYRFLHRDDVHDRPNLGALVIFLFHL